VKLQTKQEMNDSCKVHQKKKKRPIIAKKFRSKNISNETPSAMRSSMQSFEIDFKKISLKNAKCKGAKQSAKKEIVIGSPSTLNHLNPK
jgi:hypothetical protein